MHEELRDGTGYVHMHPDTPSGVNHRGIGPKEGSLSRHDMRPEAERGSDGSGYFRGPVSNFHQGGAEKVKDLKLSQSESDRLYKYTHHSMNREDHDELWKRYQKDREREHDYREPDYLETHHFPIAKYSDEYRRFEEGAKGFRRAIPPSQADPVTTRLLHRMHPHASSHIEDMVNAICSSIRN
jgi:hypothetical protein